MTVLENAQQLQQKLDQQVLLHRITTRIRQSLELPAILTATVAEVRSFLATDRIMIYRFSSDGTGEVVAESIDNHRLPSLIGLHFPADDIPAHAREMFCVLRQRTIVDVVAGKLGISTNRGDSESSLPIEYRSVDPCHQAYLMAMGVQSSLVVPILLQPLDPIASAKPQLWGLLVSHHGERRHISEADLQVVQWVVDQLGIAIAQAHLLEQTRQKAERETTINQVASLLHEHPTIELQAALEATLKAFQGVGARLYIDRNSPQAFEVFVCGEQPCLSYGTNCTLLEDHPLWRQWLATGYHPEDRHPELTDHGFTPWIITDIYKEPQWRVLIPAFKLTSIRGVLVLPIQYRQKQLGILTIFRSEIETETLWAGKFDPNAKQMMPRQSFEVWRESKQGQAQPWTEDELTLAASIAHQFAMAVQQHELYREVQTLNTNLEQQIQERTAQLQHTLEFSKALERITDQIRRTLDLNTTLSSLVREVRELLDTDRVVIYQRFGDTGGQVVFENKRQLIPSIVGMKTPDECFPSNMVELYRQGRMRAISDVTQENLTPCHRQFLNNIGVRANLIVPITQDSQLWGLLIAHECNHPREWKPDELEVLQQLADQAAIAISQAELYGQSRIAAQNEQAKAEQLAQALDELKKTQTQLIQTEKMLSLGRLVAGVAHEINNPINFIFGNLNYASEYSETLLALLNLYQKHYPQSDPEIDRYSALVDLEFITQDLPKILSSMRSGADRIRQIVLSLRNFSRLDEADLKRVDIHEGLENTLLLLQHRLNADSDFPEIQVRKCYGNLPAVECYVSLINQVFMNILTNAIDALALKLQGANQSFSTSEQTQPFLEIRTALSDQTTISPKIVISIIDNGTGIPSTLLPHIFDPFFTTKPVGQGTGLGLSISYQIIVEKHKGSLQCFSQWGGGTEFRLEIPVQQSSPA